MLNIQLKSFNSKFNKKCYILLLLFIGISRTEAQKILPLYYWTFDDPTVEREILKGKKLDTKYYKCEYDLVGRETGKAMNLKNTNCIIATGVMKSTITDEFSIEFFFKGATFTFVSFSQPLLQIQFSYPRILFKTTALIQGNKSVTDNLIVELNGSGRNAYNYYIDNNWHHLIFTASLKTGKKEIWVDGECPEDFSRSIPRGKQFEFGDSDGFRNTDQIDELAFYNKVLPAQLIKQHYTEANNGKSYSFIINKNLNVVSRKSVRETPKMDPKEFAPGYPDYTIQATDQLKSFPPPRYNTVVTVKRNMSWMDIGYLHRELPDKGGRGFGKTNPQKAVELANEMVQCWNYYIDIPTLRTTAIAAQENYVNANNIYGALVNYANQNPQYPVATILIEAQGRPVHAGLTSSNAYVSSQQLADKYYLKNEKGIPIIQDKRKWLSPLMPLDIVEKDGQTSRFYLNQLMKHLKKAPALINENGEVFGHIRKEALLKQDLLVWKDYTASELTESQYSGRFQYRIDSTYRATIMRGLNPGETHFSFYNLSAFNPSYWPDYAMRRELNRWDSQTVYPTPDFYPRWPDNWQNARGAFNGYGAVARGRVTEIALGDRFFTPFVSAGWGEEENNIRPAQWLALLKAMVMLGADFFYTGYFNVTGTDGKWPNSVGPNDPRGYAYQIAMPAYAQAIRTWVPEFFEEGELLNPADPKDPIHQFRFKTKAENELILVRKLGKRYLIYGSIQLNSNIKGNIPLRKMTSIDLEGQTISFEIRKQGSLYILDLTDKDPVFYQLDGWHQYEHPYYWDKNIIQEAEVFSDHKGDVKIVTQKRTTELIFSTYDTYIQLNKGNELTFSFPSPYHKKYTLHIKARSTSGAKQLMIVNNSGKSKKNLTIDGNEWAIYHYNTIVNTENIFIITIIAEGNGIEIDQLLMKPEN